jgi:hypothetical protein
VDEMVRPRASDRNLDLAVNFAKTVTAECKYQCDEEESSWALCEGDRSIYAAFAALLPDVARDASMQRPTNRRGVTIIEFNKILRAIGYVVIRRNQSSEQGNRGHFKVGFKTLIHVNKR